MCILSGCTWCLCGSISSARTEGWFLKGNIFIAIWHQKRADVYSPVQQDAEDVLIPCSAYESLQKWLTGLAWGDLLAFRNQSWNSQCVMGTGTLYSVKSFFPAGKSQARQWCFCMWRVLFCLVLQTVASAQTLLSAKCGILGRVTACALRYG